MPTNIYTSLPTNYKQYSIVPGNWLKITRPDGSVINIEMKSGGGTARMIYSANNYTPQINAMEFY